MKRAKPNRVYFIRPIGCEGPIKIGCSRKPRSRLSGLQRESPGRLEIAAEMAGDIALERRIQAQFIGQHISGEWFSSSPELSATIEAVRTGTFDAATLPKTKRNLTHWSLSAKGCPHRAALRVATEDHFFAWPSICVPAALNQDPPAATD